VVRLCLTKKRRSLIKSEGLARKAGGFPHIRRQSRRAAKLRAPKARKTSAPYLNCSRNLNIVLKQKPDIIQLINARAGSIDAEAESKTGELLGSTLAARRTFGCTMPEPPQLDPAGPFADAAAFPATVKATVINLRAWFGEGKERRPKASARLGAEQAMNELRQRSFQMRHRYPAIDARALQPERTLDCVSDQEWSRRKTRPGAIMRTGAPRLCIA